MIFDYDLAGFWVMTAKDEEYELEQPARNSLKTEETTSSGRYKEREDYLEVIDIIGALMQNKDFPLKNKSTLIISKILSFLNKETSRDKNFTEAWLIKGTVLYKTGKYNGAIDAFDDALESMRKEISEEELDYREKNIGINYKYALKFKAFALCKLGRYKEAIDTLNEASNAFPEDSEIQDNKNMLHTLEKKKLIKGMGSPDSGLKNSRSPSKNTAFFDLDKYEESLKEFNKILESNPKDAETWGNKGFAFYMLGRYEEALSALNRSLEIEPKNADFWSFKGSALYKLARPEEALKAFDKALQKNPNIFEAWYNKGAILFELGRYKQALFAVENALRINTEDINALNLKNSTLDKLEKDKE